MKHIFTFLIISIMGLYCAQAQVVIQDFSNLTNSKPEDVFGGFGGGQTAANTAVADPADAANTVRQVTVTAGGDEWKGVFFRPQTHYMDLTSNQTVTIKVYSDSAIYLRGIMQGGQSGQSNIDEAANTAAHTGNGWETLSFTFAGATGEWDELAIRTSVDAAGALNNTAAYTAYFDDLSATQGTEIPTPVLQDLSNLKNNTPEDVFGGFGGGQTAANTAVADPADAANTVRQVTVTAGGDEWKGVFFRPQTHYMDLTSNQTVTIKVYSDSAIYLRGIMQGGQSGQSNIDEAANTAAHTGNGWETLSFTFAGATGEWDELAIRTSVDAAGALNNTAAYTAYFDDLSATQGTEIPVPVGGPTTSAPTPTKNAEDVISVFSDAYTDVATDYAPNWNQNPAVVVDSSFDPGDGNNVLRYGDFSYQGTTLGTGVDMAAMEFLHLDIWVESDDTNTYKVTPIGGGENLVDITTTPGSWNSVDIPVSSFPNVNFSNVLQMKFDGGTGAGNDIYLDNIYFWKEPTAAGADASLSDLKVDGVSLSGFGAATSYTVSLDEGTTTVPQITAVTTTDANASAVINQATAIPGDATVVVTAANGTTTQTYTVSFIDNKLATAPTTPPTRNSWDVISIYGEAYGAAVGVANNTWDDSDFTEESVAGNNVMKIDFGNFLGLSLGSEVDATEMTHMHMDFWISDDYAVGQVFHSKWSNHDGASETGAFQKDYIVGENDSKTWLSIDVALDDLVNATDGSGTGPEARANLKQFLITVSNTIDLAYVDNLYLYRSATASINDLESNVNVYPNPVENKLNISASVAIDTVSIFDLTGREVMRAAPNATAFSLDVADLNKGLYLVTVKAGEQELTTKLVK